MRRGFVVVAIRLAVLALTVSGAFGAQSYVARADDGGEAGLVIQHGDGSVDTYCVAFSGNSISGADLLAKVNIPVTQFGGLVCAVGTQEGCFEPSSFATCACQSYPPTNLYWSFFVQRYGQGWQYASSGYADPRSALKDGDMQAWRWGKAAPASAPAPAAISFERVCGHAPRGGLAAATAIPPTAIPSTVAPPTATKAITAQPTAAATNSVVPSLTAAPTIETSTAAPVLTAANTPLITNHGTATATPVPKSASLSSGSSGSNIGQIVAFVGIALLVVGVVAFAVLRKRRRGV